MSYLAGFYQLGTPRGQGGERTDDELAGDMVRLLRHRGNLLARNRSLRPDLFSRRRSYRRFSRRFHRRRRAPFGEGHRLSELDGRRRWDRGWVEVEVNLGVWR